MSGQEWRVVQSDTDPEMYAVRGVYLVADNLPIEDAVVIAAAHALLTALQGAIGALEMDLDYGKDSGDADWEGLAYQRLEAARAAIAKARGEA